MYFLLLKIKAFATLQIVIINTKYNQQTLVIYYSIKLRLNSCFISH